MENYHGIIVNISQKDSSILNKLNILGKKRSRGWILYKISCSDKDIKKTIHQLQENLKDGFYFHFYRNTKIIVVFKNKIFNAKTEKSTWKKIIVYGKSLGIPEKQLDFYPCRLEDESY